MAHAPENPSGPGNISIQIKARQGKTGHRQGNRYMSLALLAAAVLLAPLVLAQDVAQVTGVDPSSGKVNDSVTVSGTNLGKTSVSGVFLSDDKEDFKATIVEQTAEKIVMRVPQVKAGTYHVSIQVGNQILIKPVRFTVEE
jgi:hypothetical protein